MSCRDVMVRCRWWRLLRFVVAWLALVQAACGRADDDTGRSVVLLGLPGGPEGSVTAADTIDLRTIGYSRGAKDAPMTVYEFSDFGCPFCGMFARATYPELHEEFVLPGKVRWTYVPFVMGTFPNGEEAARVAECAAEQDRFWEMHDLLYRDQNGWQGTRRPAQLFGGYARELGLEESRFSTCYREGDRVDERTQLNNRAARALHIRATPSFIVNGRLVEGGLPAEQFRQLLSLPTNSPPAP